MESTVRDNILAKATHYVYELGLSVIPTELGGKKAIVEWAPFQTARATFTEIASWPLCNLAFVTGAISGIVVVDCESREDAEWFYATRGKTPTVVKTRRGFHLYFAHPGFDVKNAIKVEGRYDIRGDRGYVIAPPSTWEHENTAGLYQWALPFTRDLPPFKAEWAPASGATTSSNGKEIYDGAKYIAEIRAVSGQGGHDNTYRAAACLRASGLSMAEAMLTIQQWNTTNADPPWTDRELLHKIHDAYK